MKKTLLMVLAFAALLVATSGYAQTELVLGISEGSSGGLDHAQANAKYRLLADTIGRASKRKVNIVFIREFSSLEDGIKLQRFDFIFVRPSDYAARAVRDHEYQYVASASPDGHCLVVVKKNSPIKKIEQAKASKWVFPEQSSYMSKFCKAELRDQGITISAEKIVYTKEQSFVEKYLETGFADVGVVASYSGAGRSWEKRGDLVLHKSVAQPYFPLVANKRIDNLTVGSVQLALTALQDQTDGKRWLDSVGIQRFDTNGANRLVGLSVWLEK